MTGTRSRPTTPTPDTTEPKATEKKDNEKDTTQDVTKSLASASLDSAPPAGDEVQPLDTDEAHEDDKEDDKEHDNKSTLQAAPEGTEAKSDEANAPSDVNPVSKVTVEEVDEEEDTEESKKRAIATAVPTGFGSHAATTFGSRVTPPEPALTVTAEASQDNRPRTPGGSLM